MRDWVNRRCYDLLFWVSFFVYTFLWSTRIIGRRNMPSRGPVLLVSNHQSMLDPVLIGLASRRYLSYHARANLFQQRFLAGIIRLLGAVPIDRSFGKEGLRQTIALLDDERAVLVFPEGERTHDGELEPFKPGIALLIKRMNAVIVPVAVAGVYAAWPRNRKLPKFAPLFLGYSDATIAVSIGKPIDPKQLEGLDREELLTKLHAAVAVEFAKAKQLRRQKRPSAECL